MARPANPCVQVKGKPVQGVWRNEKGFYIRNPARTTGDKREFFASLDDAIARRDELACRPPLTITVRESDEEVVDRLGLPPDAAETMPEVIDHNRKSQRIINPETDDHRVAFFKLLGRTPPPLPMTPTPVSQSDQLDGELVTVADVGTIYLDWYAKEHWDVADLKARADAHNQLANERNGKPARTGGFRKAGDTRPRRRRRRLKEWIDFVTRRTERQRYNDHRRYFTEFVNFIYERYGDGFTVDCLSDEHFREYRDHVRQAARDQKHKTADGLEPLSNPDVWINHRFEAVTTGFRTAKQEKKIRWGRGIFGEDGHLTILRRRNTVSEARKIILTPAEFKALTKQADTQFRAMYYLAMNCGLSNADIGDITWDHVFWDRKLMIFTRKKTERRNSGIRHTPLTDEALDALRQWRDETKSRLPFIFVNPDGQQWSGTGITEKMHEYTAAIAKETGSDIEATFNSFRKSAATVVMNTTHDELTTDMFLGQAPNKMWRNYVGIAPDFLYPAVEAIRKEYFTPKPEKEPAPKPTKE